MEWKKTKIVTVVWESNGFKITEEDDEEDRPFRLESQDAGPVWFGNLDSAKRDAELQNRLALTEQDNLRLRAELAQKNGVWPAAVEPDDAIEPEDNGRGIPTDRPKVTALAAELQTVMAENSAPRLACGTEIPF